MSSEDRNNRVPGTPCVHCGVPTLSYLPTIPSPQEICLVCRLNPWDSVPTLVQVYNSSLTLSIILLLTLIQEYNRSSSTLTTAPSRTPPPRLTSTVSETTNLQYVQALQQAKNGRIGAIITAATRKDGPSTGLLSYSQNSEKPALQNFQFFFRLSNGWEDPVGEETPWSCWLPVDLEEVADNNNLQSPFYKLQPIQRLLVQLINSWSFWKRYCEKEQVTLDIHKPDSLGISFLVGSGKGKGAKGKISPIDWPKSPNQYTTLGHLFKDYGITQQGHVTLGISVVPTQFISRDGVPTTRTKRESSLPLSSPTYPRQLRLSPEVRIKTEPVFELGQRTIAPSSTLEFIDLTDDSPDESLPGVSQVISKTKHIENEVVVKKEPGAHKRAGSLSIYQPLSTAKRSKPARKGAELEERERGEQEQEGHRQRVQDGQEGHMYGGQEEQEELWQQLDRLVEESEEEQSEQSKGEQGQKSKTKSGRRVQLPQRFAD